MRSILYLIAVVYIIIWVYEFFIAGVAPTGWLIHTLLVIAIIAILIAIIQRA